MIFQLNDIFLVAKKSIETDSNQMLQNKNKVLGRNFEMFKLSKLKKEKARGEVTFRIFRATD